MSGVAACSAGDLNFKCVIHANGPVYHRFFLDKSVDFSYKFMRDCIKNILNKAHELGDITSISIPAISTNKFDNFPKDKCA